MEFKTLRYHALAAAILILIFFIINTLVSNLITPARYTIDKIAPIYLNYAYYIDSSKQLTFDELMAQPERIIAQPFF